MLGSVGLNLNGPFPGFFFLPPYELTTFNENCTGGLLENTSFENGLEGWTTKGLVTVESEGYAQDGSSFASLKAGQGRSSIRQTIERIYSGRIYTLHFKAGTLNNLFDHVVGLSFLDENGNYVKRITIQIDYRAAGCGEDYYPLRQYRL